MEPLHRKKRRVGDMKFPYEYEGWMINSTHKGMYNSVIWRAYKDERIATSNSLKSLCLALDKLEKKQ